MFTYKKIGFLLVIIIALISIKILFLGNGNKENCFPFTEEWGISTEEFEKTYQYADTDEEDGILYYNNEVNLYEENTRVYYAFKNEALFHIGYSSSQKPETGRLLFKNFEQSLKCLFGEPKESVNSRYDDADADFVLWEKDKTTIFLAFTEKIDIVGIYFYDNSNPNNKKSIEEHKALLERAKEFIK